MDLVPSFVRRLSLAKAEKVGADVDLSCDMVAGDHVGADANMFEALAAADKPGRVEVTRRAAVLLSSWLHKVDGLTDPKKLVQGLEVTVLAACKCLLVVVDQLLCELLVLARDGKNVVANT